MTAMPSAAPSATPSTDPCHHLLSIEALSDEQLHLLFSTARHWAETEQAPACLQGRTVALLFHEASTRTRVSFELAAKRLGAHTSIIEAAASSASKGETLADTMYTLAAMGVDGIVLRHSQNHAAAELARLAPPGVSLINAGDGVHAHPSQALLDVLTVERAGLAVAGATLTIVGDIRHSRVAKSNIALWQRLGVKKIRLAAPAELLPEETIAGPIEVYSDFDSALPGSDVVMMLRIQRERIQGLSLPDADAYHQAWGLTEARLARLPQHARVLHPGPMNRGVEIASSVADGPRALIRSQVTHGVYMRMAILAWSLGALAAKS